MDQAAKTEVTQMDLDWQIKGELFIAWFVHDTSGHQRRDAPHRWSRELGVDLTMDTIAQVIHECEMCCNQASQTGKTSMVWRMKAEIQIWRGLAD